MLPPASVGQVLRDARSAGSAFDEAWPSAISSAVAGLSRIEREDWCAALGSTRAAWEAAWGRTAATSAQRALAAVAGDPERQSLEADEVSLYGYCSHCDAPIMSPDRRTIYCSSRCRRDAHVVRRAA